MDIAGAVQMLSTLGVSGQANLHNTLQVAQGATFQSTMDIAGAVQMLSTLGVSGAVNLYNTLQVAQGATFQSTMDIAGAARMGSSLGVSGQANLHNALQVTGLATFNNQMLVSQGATFAQTVDIAGELSISADINVNVFHDVKVDGVGLQEQLAYLYNYLFSQSYRDICAASGVTGGVEGGRNFDQHGSADPNNAQQYPSPL